MPVAVQPGEGRIAMEGGEAFDPCDLGLDAGKGQARLMRIGPDKVQGQGGAKAGALPSGQGCGMAGQRGQGGGGQGQEAAAVHVGAAPAGRRAARGPQNTGHSATVKSPKASSHSAPATRIAGVWAAGSSAPAKRTSAASGISA
jgi:hypothetical protein